MKVFPAVAFATVLAGSMLAASTAEARIEPSFLLEYAAWQATHVVVVKAAAGGLEVVESWKGDLKPQAPVENVAFKLDAGQQAALFLIQKVDDKDRTTWEPAMGVGMGEQRFPFRLDLSVVWFDDQGKASAIQQWKNPGPALKRPLQAYSDQEPYQQDLDEAQVKKEVLRLVALQQDLQKARTIEDPAERAKAVLPLMRPFTWHAWGEGSAILRECGPAAAAQWGELLKDDSLLTRHPDILKQLVAIKGQLDTSALTDIIERELEFWKQQAPDLPLGWRGGKEMPPHIAQSVQQHNLRLSGTLEALVKHPTPKAAKPVQELRDYWQSLPQLEGNKGQQHITKLCNQALVRITKTSGEP